MAVITLCRIPPDIWWGYSLNRRFEFGMRTISRRSMAFFPPGTWNILMNENRFSRLIANGKERIERGMGSWKIMDMSTPLIFRASELDKVVIS